MSDTKIAFFQVRSMRKEGENEMNSSCRQWDSHVTKTMLVVFTVLVICGAPHVVIRFLDNVDPSPVAWMLAHMIFYLRYVIDPVIYFTTSYPYRKSLISIISLCSPFNFSNMQSQAHQSSRSRTPIPQGTKIRPGDSSNSSLHAKQKKVTFETLTADELHKT